MLRVVFNFISMTVHPLILLEQIALSYDVSTAERPSPFSHVFWNVITDEGDTERRTPIRIVGFDALHQRAEAQVARHALLDDKKGELLARLTALFPILTQADLRMQVLKRRLRLAELLILRIFKAMEIIRKHSIPLRSWERHLLEEIDLLMKHVASLTKASTCKLPLLPSSLLAPSSVVVAVPHSQEVLIDTLQSTLTSTQSILDAISRSLHGLQNRLDDLQKK